MEVRVCFFEMEFSYKSDTYDIGWHGSMIFVVIEFSYKSDTYDICLHEVCKSNKFSLKGQ